MNPVTLITAAGGNGTAIEILEQPLARTQYEQQGKTLGESLEPFGAEQAGFLIPTDQHFEMAGGEFCGNASRAAAVLFSQIQHRSDLTFTVSGYKGTVSAVVKQLNEGAYQVRCEFPGLPTELSQLTLANGQAASVVDLGGIVHVTIEAEFPSEPAAYHEAHRAIMTELGLTERDAVGVIWFERHGDVVNIHPVVWVRAIDTFFYEESCGSGTIATARVTGQPSIVQPTGQSITARITPESVTLESEMEVVSVDQVPSR